MDFELDDDVIMIRDMMRRFVQKDAQPLEMPLFTQGELTPEQEDNLKTKIIDQMGLWAVTVPEEFGGDELDLLSACLIEEELGKTFVPVDYGDISPVLFACGEEQVEAYLEPAIDGERRPVLAMREPDALRPEDWQTTAAPNDSGYVLNGRKLLGHKPREDDFFIVLARAEQGPAAFLLDPDADGVVLNGKPELVLQDCHLPAGALLGELGQGLRLGAGFLPQQQTKMGARYVGMAHRLLEMSAQYAQDWVSMGQPLSLRPAVMRMIAEMAADIEAARYMVYHTAWMIDEEQDAKHEAALLRLFTGQMIRSAIDMTIMVHGGVSYLDKIPALRMYRNLVPDQALEIGLENSRMAIANHYLELQARLAQD